MSSQGVPPRIRIWPGGGLALRPKQLPYTFQVRNLTADTLRVHARFDLADLASPSTLPLRIEPADAGLLPGQTLRFELRATGTSLRLPLRGYASFAAKQQLQTVGIEVDTVLRPVATPWRVESWVVEQVRHSVLCGGEPRFFRTCTRRGAVPLAPGHGARAAAPEEGKALGLVKTSTGPTALVRSAGRGEVWGGGDGARLDFTGLGGVGEYAGDLLLPGAAGQKLGLTVRVTHGIVPALLVVAAGIVVAMALQRYLDRGRESSRLEARVRAVGDEFLHAQRQFEASLRGVHTGYAVAASVADEQRTWMRRREELAGRSQVTAEEWKVLETAVDAARAGLGLWPEMGLVVSDFGAALRDFPARSAAPRGAPAVPEVRGTADDRGRPLELAEIGPEMEKLRAHVDRLRGWAALNTDASEGVGAAEQLLDAPAGLSPEQLQKIQAAAGTLHESWEALWTDPAFDPAELRRKVTGARMAVERIRGAGRLGARMAGPPGMDAVPAGAPRAPFPQPARPGLLTGGAAVLRRIARLDRLVSWALLGVAVLLALKELYFDPLVFGKPVDYLAAFLWGFGLKAGIEAVKSLAGSFWKRLPFAGTRI